MTKLYKFVLHRTPIAETNSSEMPGHDLIPQKSKAEVEAEAIIAQARSEADEIKARARAEAREQISEQVTKALAEFNQYLSVSETEIAGLVSECVRKLLGTMPKAELASMLVRTALSDFRSSRQITMRVPASERFSGSFCRLKDMPEFSEVIESVVSDPSLEANQCVIEVRGAKIHVGLDKQIKALEEALSQVTRHGD